MQSNLQCETSGATATVVLQGWPKPAPRMTPGGHQSEQHGVILPSSLPAGLSGRSHHWVTAGHQLENHQRICKTQGKKPYAHFKLRCIQILSNT